MARLWPPTTHAAPAVFKLGNETIGLLKRVAPEPSEYYRSMVSDPENLFTTTNAFQFDASFYFSHHLVTSERKKVSDVVIMLNGLNEIHHYHFAHYDRLGAAFAYRGLVT